MTKQSDSMTPKQAMAYLGLRQSCSITYLVHHGHLDAQFATNGRVTITRRSVEEYGKRREARSQR